MSRDNSREHARICLRAQKYLVSSREYRRTRIETSTEFAKRLNRLNKRIKNQVYASDEKSFLT